jgi:hypothetical protein
MPEADKEGTRFALVVPQQARTAALHVPHRLRALLGIDVFTVYQDGTVERE